MNRVAFVLLICAFAHYSLGADPNGPTESQRVALTNLLETIGFTFDGGGGYVKEEVRRGDFFKWFNLNEADVRDRLVMNSSRGVRHEYQETTIYGCPAMLTRINDRRGDLTSNTIVRVFVFTNYNPYPDTLRLRMAPQWVKAILARIGAKEVSLSTTEESTCTINKLRYLLPDGKGLEMEISTMHSDSKPSAPQFVGMTIGEAGKGFDGWENQHTQSVTRLPILEYKKKPDNQP